MAGLPEGMARRSLTAPVDFPPMTDPHYKHDECVFEHLIHNPVIADAEAPESPAVPFHWKAHERVLAQAVYSPRDAETVIVLDSSQFFGCALLNLNGVAHP